MTELQSETASPLAADWPLNPVQVRVWRGDRVESVHRGAWVVVDAGGRALAGDGEPEARVFARSTIKSLQALPLVETGAADRFGLGQRELALALASHNAEPCHTEPVAALLAKLELSASDLRCGAQVPGDPRTRRDLLGSGASPTALHNNCSGKHAGFLTLTRHLGADPASYLDPAGPTQTLVREAIADMCADRGRQLDHATDGCSAPTYHLSLRELATGFARVANPDGLAPERAAACRRMTAAVAAHPELIAGHHKRLCSDLARVTGGRLFPKIGAEGVYCIGEVGADRGLALKLDDGQARGLHALVLGLLERLGWLSTAELEALEAWRPGVLTNWAGLRVGHVEVVA
ncbi:asparaginase [Engelhardtia mirabilis]|uniref:L-asparaginase II n=1 Tax=Engelhardtia mirabilis TaxID=2528011 RepID=A0A518BQI9_9BACT|nr:L-asparaginase II [Planctomycetes bacterium Pla133]QDV03571.1 L-asparaginase II [Planctomycetes bacterium Pla86]